MESEESMEKVGVMYADEVEISEFLSLLPSILCSS